MEEFEDRYQGISYSGEYDDNNGVLTVRFNPGDGMRVWTSRPLLRCAYARKEFLAWLIAVYFR